MSEEHDAKAEAVYVEMERDRALDSLAEVTAERDALARFKAWVHAYLDGKDIPRHPPGIHGAEGCRIGDRMDFVFDRLSKLSEVLAVCVDADELFEGTTLHDSLLRAAIRAAIRKAQETP